MNQKRHNKTKLVRLIWMAWATLSPAIFSLAIPTLILRVSLLEYIPGFDNDEIHYWHQILTFSKVGFSGGYYTIDELPAPANFSHFGPHGLAFPVLYGTIAHVVGWYPYSPIFFNEVLLTLSLASLIYLTKPTNLQLAYIGLTVSTFWPLMLCLPTVMQETLHQVLAILIAGIFYRSLKKKNQIIIIIGGIVLVSLAALIRFTWALTALLFLIKTLKKERKWSYFLYITLLGIILIFLPFWLNRYWSSPFPNYKIIEYISKLNFLPIANNISNNINSFISFPNPRIGGIAQKYLGFIFRIELLIILFSSCISVCRMVSKSIRWNSFNWFILYILGHITILQICFYGIDSYLEYRVISPYLLMILLILILLKRNKLIKLFLVINLLTMPLFISSYREANYIGVSYARQLPANNRYENSSIVEFEKSIKDIVVYEKEISPWCNTIATGYDSYRSNLISVPAGVGFSLIINSEKLQLPLKSKYVLLSDNTLPKLRSQLNIEYLNTTPIGKLYLNLDSHCKIPDK
ncbi:MAG TPA: hypothetical protein DEG17_11900 [Cyanobacteria bacterium UBA11149]|nr:hypothetical protein [Cyanobacteria bacterium UBA11367]HBE59805.1 hypothetical protein [Cyanobacteria bacterium UBA11366]HBK64292.1 hypothetical protein [Cyanobacteria bacterium UBA11166]HBR72380.1 hypothetical protein [Cyanobacteria bacterium UBA11159]HBS70835.1 hypothetical protein [Cyanobacteria bacterium UBA11153]HBW89549.1 hypothetical protein [Cyanobacteria bacterium UBA11149]